MRGTAVDFLAITSQSHAVSASMPNWPRLGSARKVMLARGATIASNSSTIRMCSSSGFARPSQTWRHVKGAHAVHLLTAATKLGQNCCQSKVNTRNIMETLPSCTCTCSRRCGAHTGRNTIGIVACMRTHIKIGGAGQNSVMKVNLAHIGQRILHRLDMMTDALTASVADWRTDRKSSSTIRSTTRPCRAQIGQHTGVVHVAPCVPFTTALPRSVQCLRGRRLAKP
mmetsp:Transcript_144736/g.360842  ORF Transcript_144736/g.360842 Transcript_144736/m.360842 type:complete len:226 (+) Transcript_144736:760-1437(+)